ncbi:hypothetical protein Tco_1560317, partial [Tanacetum coccineum]
VHGKSVLQGHAKVHVDNVESNYKDYLLPVPTDEFSKIGETVLSFIQWPTKPPTLTKQETRKLWQTNTSTQTATKQVVATNKEPSTLKQTSPSVSRQEGPSNHIAAAAPLTKSARPLNSASKEKQELIKRMNIYRGQILKRACVRSTYERWMRNADPTRSIHGILCCFLRMGCLALPSLLCLQQGANTIEQMWFPEPVYDSRLCVHV